jgi:hypothetical protein
MSRSWLAWAFTVAGAMLLALPSYASAQAPADADRLAAVRGIDTGDYVRLQTESGPRVEGQLAVNDATSVTVFRDEAPVVEVPIPDIDGLWVRGRRTGIGALIGGGIGIAFGVVAGHTIEQIHCGETDSCGEIGSELLGGVVFGAGGALIGAGIGWLIPKWDQRFP